MLNARHKVVLFLTLVLTGCVLLAGASLKQGLGLLILGAAFSWLIGSRTLLRAWCGVRALPAKVTPWFRLPIIFAVAGGLFGVVLVWSKFNTFLAIGAMLLWGLILASDQLVATNHRVARIAIWVSGLLSFFFALIFVSYLLHVPVDKMERVGQLSVAALIAMCFGRYWVSRGWVLILSSVKSESSEPAPQTESEVTPARSQGSAALYISLFFGVFALLTWLTLLAFNGFTGSIVPLEERTPPGQTTLPMVLIFVLLTWWPYAAWRGILRREPNSSVVNRRRHKITVIAVAALAVVLLSLATTFGLQNGYDRQATLRIDANTKDFTNVATKIGAIKSRNLETTDDYIAAYAEIRPLLDEFDLRLQAFDDVLAEVNERDKTRGPLNIQFLYARRHQQTAWNSQVFKLLKDDSIITRKQIHLMAQMATLPEADRVDFWDQHFRPLAEEEARLREELATLLNSNKQAVK